MPDIGDIVTARIYFRGNAGDSKVRPVLIVNADGAGNYTIAEITSVGSKTPPTKHDKYKEEITCWDSSGLDRPSYVKCKNIHNVSGVSFINHIGKMGIDEFEYITDKIVEYQDE